jgi:copper chaperone
MAETGRNICTVSLSVPGMSCSHCEGTIRKAVGLLDGVGNIDIDLKSKNVTVKYDANKISVNAIKEIIEDQGYDVDYFRN